MGRAREVMDRLTEAVTVKPDLEALWELFAEDAVAVTPDGGEIHGRDRIVAWWRQTTDAIPEARFEPLHLYEVGDTAIDEGFFGGRNTGPLQVPSGEVLPATQREIRVRGVDLVTVGEDGRIVSYRLYFDQLDFLGQLGLLPDVPAS
ncbi:nuclear transport factor 2 family protein [Streptomyces sp. NPDC052682]|uniref:ester cyclase n=1 Tax=Streptomyces sp. NPDC052682 TaxID=3154954 RepID=UPI003418372C